MGIGRAGCFIDKSQEMIILVLQVRHVTKFKLRKYGAGPTLSPYTIHSFPVVKISITEISGVVTFGPKLTWII